MCESNTTVLICGSFYYMSDAKEAVQGLAMPQASERIQAKIMNKF